MRQPMVASRLDAFVWIVLPVVVGVGSAILSFYLLHEHEASEMAEPANEPAQANE